MGQDTTGTPEISVVIPTHRDAVCLELTLRTLARQSLAAERFEVVVVRDGGPADGYAQALRAGKGLGLRYVELAQQGGRAAARNEGVRQSSAPLLLFLDADSYSVPQLVERHVEHHAVPGRAAVLIGRREEMGAAHLPAVLAGAEVPPVPGIWPEGGDMRFPYGAPDRHPHWLRAGWMFGYSHNISLARALFDRAGGFNEEFGLRWGLEDIELFYRVHQHLGPARLNFAYDSEARAFHLPHHRDMSRNFGDMMSNQEIVARTHRSIEWEFFGILENHDAVERIVRYRSLADECARRSSCAIAPAAALLAGTLPGPRVLWVGTGGDQAALPAEALTFDYAAPPGPTNFHLVGMNPPVAPGELDAVVSVDFWRHLLWPDLCQFVNAFADTGAEVHLVGTPDTSPDIATDPAVLDYLCRAFDVAFDTQLRHVEGLGVVLSLRRPAGGPVR